MRHFTSKDLNDDVNRYELDIKSIRECADECGIRIRDINKLLWLYQVIRYMVDISETSFTFKDLSEVVSEIRKREGEDEIDIREEYDFLKFLTVIEEEAFSGAICINIRTDYLITPQNFRNWQYDGENIVIAEKVKEDILKMSPAEIVEKQWVVPFTLLFARELNGEEYFHIDRKLEAVQEIICGLNYEEMKASLITEISSFVNLSNKETYIDRTGSVKKYICRPDIILFFEELGYLRDYIVRFLNEMAKDDKNEIHAINLENKNGYYFEKEDMEFDSDIWLEKIKNINLFQGSVGRHKLKDKNAK